MNIEDQVKEAESLIGVYMLRIAESNNSEDLKSNTSVCHAVIGMSAKLSILTKEQDAAYTKAALVTSMATESRINS